MTNPHPPKTSASLGDCEGERHLTANDSLFVNHEAPGENRKAEIASICCLFGRFSLFATRCSPVLQNIITRASTSAAQAAPAPDACAALHAGIDDRPNVLIGDFKT
jgi:hypothetical protein